MRASSLFALPAVAVACVACNDFAFGGGGEPGGFIECTADVDCVPGTACDVVTGTCQAGFEGEGEEGEGEGEGACTRSAFARPDGDGTLLISDAVLDFDLDNFAVCVNPADAYFAFFFVDRAVNADFSGNEVRFSVDGAFPRGCTGRILVQDDLVVCPICFTDPPFDMTLQLEGDDGALSNAVCVDTSAV